MRYLLLALLLVPAAAPAATRTVSIGSFERIRIDGPFEVRVETGRSPGATISGDGRATEDVEVRVTGSTLVVGKGLNGWGEQSRTGTGPVVVTLTTPTLVSAVVVGGGRVTISGMKAMRVDLSVSGAGSLTLAKADTDQLNATVIGTGQMTIGGRAARARLTTSGPGVIDASALDTSDLIVSVDGVGDTKARARGSAQVTNTGLGKVTVLGPAKCVVKAPAGGPVICGAASP
ncbi:GIN domain-containing protein [Sphingomonas sp. R86521]|uniref:GIN domain-containing protein n=1 Tax=Sphingomonas sp. R86521 TaxID=3093860 RepID=UPI0036D25888